MGIEVRGPTAAQSAIGIGAQVKAFMIRTFEEVLVEEVGKGFDRQPLIITDGTARRDYRSVRNFGRIEARARSTSADVVLWLLDELRRLSPIGPGKNGHYRDAHRVYADGREVTDLKELDAAKRVMVVNVKPYAGKIEGKDAYTRWETKGGKKSRRAMRRRKGYKPSSMRGQSRQAPNGVYRVALRNLQRRYGKSVFALFQPQKLPLGVKVSGYSHGRSKRVLKDQIYPAIIIRVAE